MRPIDKALNDLASQDKPNYAATADKYGVHRSTLSRRHRKITTSREIATANFKSLLTPQQEKELVEYINKLSVFGLPPVISMVRNFAYDICKKMPGKNWPTRFIEKHRAILDSGFLKGFDLSRKKADSPEAYRRYFKLLFDKIRQYDILPENSYNMDEKGFLIGVIRKMRRVFSKEAFDRGRIKGAGQDGNREWITLLASICMDGTWIPPALIYQAVSGDVQDTWVTEVDPEEHQVHFASSATGWTNEDLGFMWLTTIFDRYTKEKARLGRDWRLLMVDGHNSHLNMRFLDWCEAHRILVCAYPSHSTHRLQPLDVSLFGRLAQYYSEGLDNYIYTSFGRRGMSKREFFGIFWPAFERAFTEENIKSGWAKTGIWPHDEERVIRQVEPHQQGSRPGTASSNSSAALSKAQARDVRQLANEVLDISDPKHRKLLNTMESIHAQNELLQHENQHLRQAFAEEKKRRQRAKPLFEQLRKDTDGGAMFFSPMKIQEARDLQAQKESEKQQEDARKVEAKRLRALAKEEKQRGIENRKQQRAIAAEARKVAEAEKRATREEAKQAKEASKQLQAELKQHKGNLRKASKGAVAKKKVIIVDKSDVEEELLNFTPQRPRRRPGKPKWHDDYEVY